MKRYGSGAAIAWLLSACQPAVEGAGDGAHRIVSLDYCADQYVMQFVDKAEIAALSPDAGKDFSYLRAQSVGLPIVRPRAEDILALRPTMVVRSFGGDAGIDATLAQAGVTVVQLGYAQSLGDVRAELVRVGGALGAAGKATAIARDFDRRLDALPPKSLRRPRALYMTPGGVTTGAGSLIDEMMARAGLSNFQGQSGWNTLPLERMTREQPDMIVAAFYGENGADSDQWSAAQHPVATAAMHGRPVAHLSGASVSCGGWFMLDAVEAMAAKRVAIE